MDDDRNREQPTNQRPGKDGTTAYRRNEEMDVVLETEEPPGTPRSGGTRVAGVCWAGPGNTSLVRPMRFSGGCTGPEILDTLGMGPTNTASVTFL